MPAFGYGPWLSVAGMNGGRPLDIDGVEEYLRRIGADPMLYTRGASEHGRVLDHFRDHDIDYQVIVGGGLPSIGGVGLKHGIQDEATIRWVTGDETVPAFSGAHDTPRDRLHYVCGISHVPLTTDPQTTRLMDDFVIRGEPMRDEQTECPWTARELTTYDRDSPSWRCASRARSSRRCIAGGRSYSLDEGRAGQARAGRDARRRDRRSSRWAAPTCASSCPPARPRRCATSTEKGASAAQHGASPVSGGAVALGGSGAVTAGGKAVKPAKADTRAPSDAARREARSPAARSG